MGTLPPRRIVRQLSQTTNNAVVKVERKSDMGPAKYSASSPVNAGAMCGITSGMTRSSGTKNRICRVRVRKMDLAGWPVAWK